MALHVIRKGEIGNDPSKEDGIGAKFARMPAQIFNRLMQIPEFDWILESPYPSSPNWGLQKFIELNPQFFVTNADKFKSIYEYPAYVINKDGRIFDLNTMKFKPAKRKGYHNL